MSDLIERLKLARRMVAGQYDMKTIDLAITALSPVLPDELDEVLKLCQTPRTRDLLERQAREIERLTQLCITYQERRIASLKLKLKAGPDSYEKQISELQAKIKELEDARNEALEYLQREGTPYVNSAIAALQENNDE